MASSGQSALAVYPVTSYNFGQKDNKHEKDISNQDRFARLQHKYNQEGLRKSVEGILLVHQHNHPHVLLLQVSSAWKLPGGRLRPGEDEVEGLKRKLIRGLSPTSSSLTTDWEIGECVGTFWRPNFDVNMYPYLPAHITKPKEVKRLYIIPLPEKCYFAVPKNHKLLAVPLFELHDNASKFGSVIAALPQLMSRFKLNLSGQTVQTTAAKQETDETAGARLS
ncbi:Pre-mRNA cleavage factor Im subunit 2 [Trebouxia sp. C0010 RCD-2024]